MGHEMPVNSATSDRENSGRLDEMRINMLSIWKYGRRIAMGQISTAALSTHLEAIGRRQVQPKQIGYMLPSAVDVCDERTLSSKTSVSHLQRSLRPVDLSPRHRYSSTSLFSTLEPV